MVAKFWNQFARLSFVVCRPVTFVISFALVCTLLSTIGAWSEVVAFADGSANAPDGPPQHPNLLDSYATRPPWKVAGVDYAVGVTPGTVVKIPSPANLPPGALLSGGAIHVTGANVTLDGYDFTNLTVMIDDTASGTITISNCAAIRGAIIRSTVGASAALVVKYCSLDGGGTASDPNFATIKVWCPLTVQYSWIKDSGQGVFEGGKSLTIQYNLLEGFAWFPGAHANAIYVSGSADPSISRLISHNTIYSENSRDVSGFPVGIGAAIAFFGDGGNFYDSTVSYNTLISAMPGAASYIIGFYVDVGASATNGKIRDNYFASVNGFKRKNSGAFGAFYTGSTGVVQSTYVGNIDMANGLVISGINTFSRK
jgi:hypothetical protein